MFSRYFIGIWCLCLYVDQILDYLQTAIDILDGRRVLIFNNRVLLPCTGKESRMVGWSYPDLLKYCKGALLNEFADSTFWYGTIWIFPSHGDYVLYVPVFLFCYNQKMRRCNVSIFNAVLQLWIGLSMQNHILCVI